MRGGLVFAAIALLGACGGSSSSTPDPGKTATSPHAIVQVASGLVSVCALRAEGTVLCWGSNGKGQLGDGTTTAHATPALVPGLSDVVEIVSSHEYVCARRKSGTVACWGDNAHGQLGDGTTENRASPVDVKGITQATQIAVGLDHTCAVSTLAGAVSCWGHNNVGQVGAISLGENVTTPTAIVGSLLAAEVRASVLYTCARVAPGDLMCWGANSGNVFLADAPSTVEIFGPTKIPGVSNVASLALGDDHACVVEVDGTVLCWGANASGALGLGTDDKDLHQPTPVPAIKGAKKLTSSLSSIGIASGGAPSCALDGTSVYCWGPNAEGQLGDGTTTVHTSPTKVVGLDDAVDVSLGHGALFDADKWGTFACAVKSGGGVACWGSPVFGAGDGKTPILSPVTIAFPP